METPRTLHRHPNALCTKVADSSLFLNLKTQSWCRVTGEREREKKISTHGPENQRPSQSTSFHRLPNFSAEHSWFEAAWVSCTKMPVATAAVSCSTRRRRRPPSPVSHLPLFGIFFVCRFNSKGGKGYSKKHKVLNVISFLEYSYFFISWSAYRVIVDCLNLLSCNNFLALLLHQVSDCT